MNKLIATAEAPNRSTNTITLSWGLMNMSLSLYTGTEDVSVTRKEFVLGDPDRPAGRAITDKSTGEIVEYQDVKRLTQATNGTWVDVTDDEMADAIGVKNVAEVITFAPADEAASAYVVDAYHQIRPKANKGAVDPASAKAFAILTAVLAERNLVAIVSLATRGPAKYALVTATGDLLFIRSTDEVRACRPLNLPAVDSDHLKMANQLVDAIGTGLPELPNKSAAAIQAIADAKAGGLTIVPKAAPDPTEVPDVMASLLASIDAAKTKAPWGAPTGAPVEVEEVA